MSSKSTPTDLVSESDVAAEALIRAELERHRPDDAILGEEGGDSAGVSGRRWIVDPLDGTVNFLYGIPHWSVSIALDGGADGGRVGAIYDAMRDELWTGVGGEQAYLNGEPLPPAERPRRLAEALVATGFGYDTAVRAQQGAQVARLLPAARDIRRGGAAAQDLAWAAAGRVDAYYERGVKPWDIAAGVILCELAGLEVHELPADPPAETGILVAPPGVADELLEFVR